MNPPPSVEPEPADPGFQAKLKTACLMATILPSAMVIMQDVGATPVPWLSRTSLWPLVFFLIAAGGWFGFTIWLFQGVPVQEKLWPAFRLGLVFSAPAVLIVGQAVGCLLPPFRQMSGMGPGMAGFLSLVLCQFLGVALIEELSKWWFSHPLVPATRHQRLAAGFASGLGFGLVEGLNYSFHSYAVVHDETAYLIRFIGCVPVHAAWTAIAAALLHDRRRSLDPWTEAGSVFLRVAPVALLHALINSCLDYGFGLAAIAVQIVTVAWFGRELLLAESSGIAISAQPKTEDQTADFGGDPTISVPSEDPAAENDHACMARVSRPETRAEELVSAPTRRNCRPRRSGGQACRTAAIVPSPRPKPGLFALSRTTMPEESGTGVEPETSAVEAK